MALIYETLTISYRPITLERLEALARGAAEAEWEDDVAQAELMDFANNLRARLQRIAKGDIQSD